MALIDIGIAKRHLRVRSDDDALILLYLSAAVRVAVNYIGRELFASQNELTAAVVEGTADDSAMVIQDDIVAAILLILGMLYENREDTVIGETVVGLPNGARALLWPHRIGLGV